MSFDVEVKGWGAIAKSLEELGKRDMRKILRQASRAVAKPVQQEAKARAPRDTGKLQRSIKVRAIKRSRVKVGVTIKTGERRDLGIDEDATGYYPAALEFGFKRPFGAKKGAVTFAALRYMQNAFLTNAKQTERDFIRLVREGVYEAIRKRKKN